MINDKQQVAAFAPATTSNLAVGFDILGFPLDKIGDEVWLKRREDDALVITSIKGPEQIPMDSQKNTATVAIAAMQSALNCKVELDISIKKGIALGSGLGGSAASSVAAVVAFNQFLESPLSLRELIPFALACEQAATNAIHADNIAPCLLGGLICVYSLDPVSVLELPTNDLWSAFIRLEMVIETKQSRAVLPKEVSFKAAIQYSAHLAAFISALYTNDMKLLADVCRDELVEPHRQSLIPHFKSIQKAAKQAGALACSISGAGPTIFALTESSVQANQIGQVMAEVYEHHSLPYELLISPLSTIGARSI